MQLLDSKIGTLLAVQNNADVIRSTNNDESLILITSKITHVSIDMNASGIVYLEVPSTSAVEDLQIECFVAPEAEVHLVILQKAAKNKVKLAHHSAIGRGATLHTHIATLGTSESVHRIVNHINGEQAVSNVNWLFYGVDSETHELYVENKFNAPYGSGQMLVKGVAQDTAQVTCNGMITISLEGKGTDAYLTEDVLMLDSTAKVNAIPGLEIKTNDVKASHSATISQVTEQDLFYFAARGIPTLLARHMFITGFLESVAEAMPDELRPKFIESIEQKLNF